MRILFFTFGRCKHRDLDYPVGNFRRCKRCGVQVPFETLALTTTDRQQGTTANATLKADPDLTNLRRVHREGKVADIRKARS